MLCCFSGNKNQAPIRTKNEELKTKKVQEVLKQEIMLNLSQNLHFSLKSFKWTAKVSGKKDQNTNEQINRLKNKLQDLKNEEKIIKESNQRLEKELISKNQQLNDATFILKKQQLQAKTVQYMKNKQINQIYTLAEQLGL